VRYIRNLVRDHNGIQDRRPAGCEHLIHRAVQLPGSARRKSLTTAGPR
jgi:hypothetical protein